MILGAGKFWEAIRVLAEMVRDNPSNTIARTRLFAALTERDLPWPVLPPLLHDAEVRQGAFTPDSQWLLTAAADGSLSVWSSTSGVRQVMLPHATERGRFAVSPAGTHLATLAANGAAQVWQLPEGKLSFETSAGKSLSVALAATAFSPDNTLLATAALDGRAALWRVADGQCLGSLDHGEPLRLVLFRPQGQSLLTVGASTCKLWPVPRLMTATPGSRAVMPPAFTCQLLAAPTHAEFTTDGGRFLTAATNGVVLWDAVTGGQLESFAYSGQVNFATFGPGGKYLATANSDDRAHLQLAAGGEFVGRSLSHDLGVNTIRFDASGKRMVTASDGGRAQVWRQDTMQPEFEPCRHPLPVLDAVFSPGAGQRLLTLSADRSARLWALDRRFGIEKRLAVSGLPSAREFSPDGATLADLGTNGVVGLLALNGEPRGGPASHPQTVTCVCFSPDSRWLASADAGGLVLVSSVQPSAVPQLRLPHDGPVTRLEWSRDSRTLAAVTASNVCLWQPAASSPPPPLQLAVAGVRSLDFSPNGRRLALGGNVAAQIFDPRSGRNLSPELPHPSPVTQVCFSPDGRQLATGGNGNAARVWDTASGQPVSPWVRPGSDVTCLAWSPDGGSLLTGSLGGVVALWDPRTGQFRQNLVRHRSAVLAAEFSPDGVWVASSSADRMVRLLHADSALPGRAVLKTTPQCRVRFSPNGRLLLIAGAGRMAYQVNVPAQAMPGPDLLLALTEFVVGQRLNSLGGWEDLTPEEWWVRQRQITQRWSRWGPPRQLLVLR